MSVNLVIIQGTVSTKPEIRTIGASSRAVFAVETRESWFDKQRDSIVEHTELHSCVAKVKNAEAVIAELDIGVEVLAEGKMRTRRWVDKKTATMRQATDGTNSPTVV